jgi:hypothetical protein
MTRLQILLFLAALSGCATTDRAAPTASVQSCQTASPLQSRAGKAWWEQNRWRFQDDDQAERAYATLARDASPWPDWYTPYERELAAGTRFQMAIGRDQSPSSPGNFGTFDRIRSVRDVRTRLAVRSDWKPVVDRVVTYEVVTPFRVKIGPIGPQVDGQVCRLLPGRWSQFQALVPRGTLIDHLSVIDVRPLR